MSHTAFLTRSNAQQSSIRSQMRWYVYTTQPSDPRSTHSTSMPQWTSHLSKLTSFDAIFSHKTNTSATHFLPTPIILKTIHNPLPYIPHCILQAIETNSMPEGDSKVKKLVCFFLFCPFRNNNLSFKTTQKLPLRAGRPSCYNPLSHLHIFLPLLVFPHKPYNSILTLQTNTWHANDKPKHHPPTTYPSPCHIHPTPPHHTAW